MRHAKVGRWALVNVGWQIPIKGRRELIARVALGLSTFDPKLARKDLKGFEKPGDVLRRDRFAVLEFRPRSIFHRI